MRQPLPARSGPRHQLRRDVAFRLLRLLAAALRQPLESQRRRACLRDGANTHESSF